MLHGPSLGQEQQAVGSLLLLSPVRAGRAVREEHDTFLK
ncbi:hypothetical protein HaLaN_14025 [Haematococcus lacustris]|uniref:Uncharacterized protein n=1 Tax=Haematococcus lacustris TaxID=44745 RepID=A0A699Z739_HAELA|nr:hypothetical protein HaLaN_14025 [Haematococcus lacustris]